MAAQNIQMALIFPERESMYKASLLLCKQHDFVHAFGAGVCAIVFHDLHDIDHAIILSRVIADEINLHPEIKTVGFEVLNVDNSPQPPINPVIKFNPN